MKEGGLCEGSALARCFGFAVPAQFFDRLLKLKADDVHQGTFERRFSEGASNGRTHLIADQVLEILM
jgi:hypothetical protein